MRLDHLLAADPLGAPLDDRRKASAVAVLKAFGFVQDGGAYVLDETFPWVVVEEQDGLWRVHVDVPLPAHLFDTVCAALEGLSQEANLVRIDPLSRREISAMEWSRRLAAVTGPARLR